jgi:hypothetical protein
MNIRLYKITSLALALVFASVGALFLLKPDVVLAFMNGLGRGFGCPEAPLNGAGFYLALAVGYMYVVTLLAGMMFRNPSMRILPFLLAQAKGASGLLSVGLFIFHRSYFVYAANGAVDLALCGLAAFMATGIRKSAEAAGR